MLKRSTRFLTILALLVAAVAVVLATAVTDDFDRADDTTLGGNWTEQTTDPVLIFSNNAQGSAANIVQLAFYNAASFSNDQYSEAVIALHGTEGVSVRASGTGGSRNCYYAWATSSFGYAIFKIVAGTETTLVSGATNYTTGDTIRLEVSGTTLTLKKNGSTVDTTTDSSLASGSPGVMSYDTSARLASWAGGDSAGAPATPRNLLLTGVGQ